ncbi:MAG: tetratricopeptide repeat protein, partial [Prochlorothrix sp.]
MADFQDFITHNQAAFNQLLTFIDFAAERLTIAFVSVNFVPDREAIIAALREQPQCEAVQLVELEFRDSQLQQLQGALLERLAQVEREPGKKLVLLITGLEQSIGMSGDYPPLLQDLNFVRDGFGAKVPHPLVFFLPDYSITRLARFAPDFWAWELGLFRFETLPQRVRENYAYTLESERIREGLDLRERQERVDLLQRLLMEYKPQGISLSLPISEVCTKIYREIGRIYYQLGEIDKAKDSLLSGLHLASNFPELQNLKAWLLGEFADCLNLQGEIDAAYSNYQEARSIFHRFCNQEGEAATLHEIAGIQANQGDIQGAIDLYQQSLQLQEQIGNIQGKAATLHQLAILKANQGDIQGAIDLYQQSL